ncbi:MAG TPA: hypothetical protein VFY23_00310 [Candidatus Limnocylindrales bacterium]|nr:hypothetical protein [Candidatus Limnocylindrales bacterium]
MGRDAGEVLAPREEARLEQSVVRVGGRERGPLIAAALIAAAFLLGLLRPWDLLGADAAPAEGGPASPAPAAIATGGDSAATSPAGSDAVAVAPGRTPPPTPRPRVTCGYPAQWRTSTIEDWTGRAARVWKAAEVVEAAGPDDPAIRFEPIVAATVTAIGWCAPVDGPERPPLALDATLWRIVDGVARQVAYDRLEPSAPDALGELWVPVPRSVGLRPPWAMGRYVIELRSRSGSYLRYLGLELTDRVVRPSPAPSPAPASSGPPSAAPASASPPA